MSQDSSTRHPQNIPSSSPAPQSHFTFFSSTWSLNLHEHQLGNQAPARKPSTRTPLYPIIRTLIEYTSISLSLWIVTAAVQPRTPVRVFSPHPTSMWRTLSKASRQHLSVNLSTLNKFTGGASKLKYTNSEHKHASTTLLLCGRS